MAIVRQHFEPSYKAKDDQIVEVSDAYSLLKVFNKELTEKDSDELIEMYFAGTKIVAFVKSEISWKQDLMPEVLFLIKEM